MNQINKIPANQYLKSFVVASSWIIVIPFLLFVAYSKEKKFLYKPYSMIAPIYFGVMNMISLVIQQVFNLSRLTSLLIISQISAIFIICLITRNQSYKFASRTRWLQQYLIVYFGHLATYLMINFLETTFLETTFN